ncbi:unnamed protein product [Schistosoma turkestanicum]|nr:unnamed protein product [Schistosoma turkestanicum]
MPPDRCRNMLKEKAYFLFKWLSLKVLGQSFLPKFLYPIIEYEEGTWEINESFVSGLSSFELYSGVYRIIDLKVSPQDFSGLLDELTQLSGGRQLTLDPAVLESYAHNLMEMKKDHKPIYYDSEVIQNPYIVRPTDLMYPHFGSKNGESSQTDHPLDLIWLASHIALTEIILRTYLSNLVTQVKLIDALSIVTGCRLKEDSIKGLQGADGVLFWLFSVAARAATVLGINDCTEWLTIHLFGGEKSKDAQSPGSCGSTYTINTDSLKESADKFLGGLAMANLVALAFHFYCPELAPAEEFLLNFPSTGEMEPAASHHNARAIASICQKNTELYNVLFLMPDSCNGNLIRLSDTGSTTLSTLNLVGFCSQGLARSPIHRRLQHAAMAGELFSWFTSRTPSREIIPMIPSVINCTEHTHETNTEHFQDLNIKEFTGSKDMTSDTVNHQNNMIPLDQININNSTSGRGTFRLYEKLQRFHRQEQQQQQQTNQKPQTSYFIRSKTIRLNKNLSDVEKLNSKLNELSTKHLIDSKTGGIYFPDDTNDTLKNEEDKQFDVVNGSESQNALTKWNPLEALFKTRMFSESNEVFNSIPFTENHVAETECTEHHCSEEMSYYPMVDYESPITTQGNILNYKITNVDTAHVTTITKSQYLKEVPFTDEAQATCHSQAINSKYFRQSRSLSNNRMMHACFSSRQKSQKYGDFDASGRSSCQTNYSRKQQTDHHDKSNRFFKWFHRPYRKKHDLTSYDVDGYSDSDLNTVYYRGDNSESSSTDYSSSSELSNEIIDDIVCSNYSEQKHHDRHPVSNDNTDIGKTVTQNKLRKPFNRKNIKRKRRNISETVTQSYFYGCFPIQHQVHRVYPYETSNQKVYVDIHCSPCSSVQPTWIHSPFIKGTLNPIPFNTTNQPTSPVIPPLHSTSPLPFSHSNNTDQLLLYNLNEQNVSLPESTNPNQNIITETLVSTETASLQAEDCSLALNTTVQNRPESRAHSVTQHEIIPELDTTTSINSPTTQVPACYSQAESFFISLETNPSSVSSTIHHKHNLKSKSKSGSLTNPKSVVHNLNGLKYSRASSNGVINNLDSMRSEPVNTIISTAQRKIPHLSGSHRNTSVSDATEKLENNIHTTTGHSVNNCKSEQLESKPEENNRPRKDSILPSYLEKRSMKAYEKETNNTENSRPVSGKSKTTSKTKENSFKINENVNTSDMVASNNHRRTASVSRTIGIVKPSFTGGRRRYAQDELSLLNVKSQSHTIENEPPSDLKLFVQLQTKSNRRSISNALNYCCLAGPVNEIMKRTALEALGCSDGKHFIILLKSQCQYSGLYNYLPLIEKAIRISGTGPSKIENNMVDKYYKYDSGLKRFVEIYSTSHMSTVVDAVQLHGRIRSYSAKSYATQKTNSAKCPLHAK